MLMRRGIYGAAKWAILVQIDSMGNIISVYKNGAVNSVEWIAEINGNIHCAGYNYHPHERVWSRKYLYRVSAGDTLLEIPFSNNARPGYTLFFNAGLQTFMGMKAASSHQILEILNVETGVVMQVSRMKGMSSLINT